MTGDKVAGPTLSILDACADVFPAWFKDRNTWTPWFAFLRALFALPMSGDELALYRQYTGRQQAPSEPAGEAWLCIGRRGGKSFVLSLVAVFLACFHDYRQYLNKGERGTVMVIAQDRKQARVCMRFIRALLQVPMLARMVERRTSDSFDLNNQITIEIHSASYRSTRGYTIVACLCDEIAYWPSEDYSAQPDFEILNAIKPGLGTIPNAMLLCASSPFAKKGALWDAHRKHFGKDADPVLIWQAETRQMNPTFRQSVIAAAMEEDPAKAAAEYLAQFRQDIEGYITHETLNACVDVGTYERPYQPHQGYVAFVDPSGGGPDSFTLGIAHKENDTVVLDCLREIRGSPVNFSPEAAVAELSQVAKSYRVNKACGDRYGKEWPREAFRKHGLAYEVCPQYKSDLYHSLLPLLNSKRVRLLDQRRLISQLLSLERSNRDGGKIDHPNSAGAHDDVANAAAGALVTANAVQRQRLRFGTIRGIGGGCITWDDPKCVRIRLVKVAEPIAPASRGIV